MCRILFVALNFSKRTDFPSVVLCSVYNIQACCTSMDGYAWRKYLSVYIIYNALMPCCKRLFILYSISLNRSRSSSLSLSFSHKYTAHSIPFDTCYVFTKQTTNMNLIINEKHTVRTNNWIKCTRTPCFRLWSVHSLSLSYSFCSNRTQLVSHSKQWDENGQRFKYSITQRTLSNSGSSIH